MQSGARPPASALEQDLNELTRIRALADVGRLSRAVFTELDHQLSKAVADLEFAANEVRMQNTPGEAARGALEDALAGLCVARDRVTDIRALIAREVRPIRPVDAAVVASAAIRLVGLDVREEIVLRVDGLPPPVLAPEGQLRAVIVNLLLNACDSIRPGGQVHVAVSRAKSGVDVAVADDGPGFGDAVPVLGAGLELSRHAMRSFGGELTIAKSALGGAEVTLHLPAAERGE